MKYIAIGVVVAALLFGGWYLAKPKTASDTLENTGQNTTLGQTEPDTTAQPGGEFNPSGTRIAGNYYQFTTADYSAAKAARRPIFLYFYANWCPTCAQQEPIVQQLMREIENESHLDDIVAFRVNFNDSDTDNGEEALAREFGVTYQHTMFVLDEDGNQYQKFLGQTSKETLKNAFGDVAGI